MATAPFDLHWSLTTPQIDDNTKKAKTYKPSELPTLDIPKYFLITDSYVKLIAPVAGATTTLSEKTRSELREYTADGSAEQNWKATGGTHSIGASLVVKDLPDSDGKGGAFIGQIHVEDGKNPLLKFKCEDDGKGTRNLIVSFRANPDANTATANSTLMSGVAKGARIQYYAKVNSSGQLSAYFEVNGDRRTFSGDLSLWVAQNPNTEFYFKAGVYNDVVPGASTGDTDTSEAWFYKLTTTHS
ncbi:polysaccharide lyase family 7 protein [Pseudomonas oryzihabitans]|uniref:polysaccharide lyase family 7 protein n=1 Tax=Pseudomonas oryzihabitans TaxID=47885 RepID=UPI00119FB338|nr:polysaccharide lyase family 7 protein [Pseudomonas psychrotolerans]